MPASLMRGRVQQRKGWVEAEDMHAISITAGSQEYDASGKVLCALCVVKYIISGIPHGAGLVILTRLRALLQGRASSLVTGLGSARVGRLQASSLTAMLAAAGEQSGCPPPQ